MSNLLAGAATTDITPPLGAYLAGYYRARRAEDVHDPLFARALCLSDGSTTIALVSCDLIGLPSSLVTAIKERIADLCGLGPEQVLAGCTHTHTGPETRGQGMFPVEPAYSDVLVQKVADSVALAKRRLEPAQITYGLGSEGSVSFNRRFWMRDGTLRTNPGIGNPDIVRPAGPIDPTVGVIALRRPDGSPIAVWLNFAVHLDTTGGNSVSADYPYYLTQALQARFGPGLVVLFNPGAMGDINHIDVNAKGQPVKGESHPSRIGNTLAGEALKILARANYTDSAPLSCALAEVDLPLRQVTPERAAEAQRVVEQVSVGEADFTLEVVAARRDRDLGRMQAETLRTTVQALRIGNVGIVGVPGELFVELGLDLKERSPLEPTFVVELANDSIGYIPTRKAFDEGGYEATSTVLAPGAGEMLIDAGLKLLQGME